jgi:hypothetical protein
MGGEMKAESEKFSVWFKRQFGALPLSSKKADALREELNGLRQRTSQVEYLLNCDSTIKAQFTGALYADNRARSAKK